jgi:hypothetical protein
MWCVQVMQDSDHNYKGKRRYCQVQKSKTLGSSAVIMVTDIVRFPQFQALYVISYCCIIALLFAVAPTYQYPAIFTNKQLFQYLYYPALQAVFSPLNDASICFLRTVMYNYIFVTYMLIALSCYTMPHERSLYNSCIAFKHTVRIHYASLALMQDLLYCIKAALQIMLPFQLWS